MVESRVLSRCAMRWDSTTSHALRSAFRSPGLLPRMLRSPTRSSAESDHAVAAQVPPIVGGPARPLRIALVTEYYYPHLGGICEHVHFFAREARRFGHHVDIITSNIEGARATPNVIRIGRSQTVYSNGSQARVTVGVGLKRQLKATFKRGDYDVVHIHSPLNPSLPFLAIDAANCPVVGTFHTYFDNSYLYGIG